MSSNLSIRILPEALRTLAAGSISAAYARIGSPFVNPIRIIYIYNGTDVLLTFSWDGVNDHQVLPPSGFLLLDVTTNHSATGGMFAISAGTQMYVKGTPSTGSVYLSVYYGSNG